VVEGKTISAGNASQRSTEPAACVIMSDKRSRRQKGLKRLVVFFPRFRRRGVEPDEWGSDRGRDPAALEAARP